MNLLERVKKDMRATSSLMDGRIKGEVKTETVYVVKDFAILNDKKNNSEYTVFVSEGSPNNFYFGGTVVTDKFKRIIELVTDEELDELKKEGIPVMFIMKKSKNKRNYMDMELI